MQNLDLNSILTKEWLRSNFALESKGQFTYRVHENYDVLNLNKKPFDTTPDMIEQVWNLTSNYQVGGLKRAQEIYYWMTEKFYYDKSMKNNYYLSASETFRIMRGVCREAAFLYTTMARIAGINSKFVLVYEKENSEYPYHACSSIEIDNKSILVDITESSFGIAYKNARILNDQQAISHYYLYSPPLNNLINNRCKKRKRTSSLKVGVLSALGIFPVLNYNNLDIKLQENKIFTYSLPSIRSIKNKIIKYKDELFSSNIEYKLKPLSDADIENQKKYRFNQMLGILKEVYPHYKKLKNVRYPKDYDLINKKYLNYRMSY